LDPPYGAARAVTGCPLLRRRRSAADQAKQLRLILRIMQGLMITALARLK
jgi:hypothetical protein